MATRRRPGSGSLYQRDDGLWVAQIRAYDAHAGKSVKIRRYAKSRDEARKLLRQLQAHSAPPAGSAGSTTVARYLRSWATTSLPVAGLAPNTVTQYNNLIRSPLVPTLGQVRLDEFTAVEAEKWLKRLDAATTKPGRPKTDGGPPTPGRPLAASTKRSAFAVLSKALDTAVRDGLIASNPLSEVARPKKTRQLVPVLTEAEVDQLLEVVSGSSIEPLVTFTANTGTRIGEALTLRWTDVDLARCVVTIGRGSITRDSTKTGSIRTLPLVPDAVDALNRQQALQAENRQTLGDAWTETGLVFTSGKGTALDDHNARRQLRAVLKKAGLPTNRPWHTQRHSMATRLQRRGVPMPIVAALLGHSSIRTTVDTYGHHDPVASAELLATALARPVREPPVAPPSPQPPATDADDLP